MLRAIGVLRLIGALGEWYGQRQRSAEDHQREDCEFHMTSLQLAESAFRSTQRPYSVYRGINSFCLYKSISVFPNLD
jgi:hypothetical protein